MSKDKIDKTDAEWRDELDTETYRVCREKGTEPAFTGAYWDLKDEGMYRCAACGEPLFSSGTKYDSGSGWPSFYAPVDSGSVGELPDN
ncbi:MAG: peptide-methionine (R)-S-oxide reductase, partial [Gammaproteobacteria bacterium]